MNLPMLISKLFTALIVAVFALLLVLETARPLRRPKRGRGPRFRINFCLTALAFAAGTLMVRPAALGLA